MVELLVLALVTLVIWLFSSCSTKTNQSVTVPDNTYDDKTTPKNKLKSKKLEPPPHQQPVLKNFDPDTCQFCSVELVPNQGIMVSCCLHVFCKECLQTSVETQPDKFQIPCPVSEEKGCGGFLADFEVKAVVTPEVFHEYIDRSLVVAKGKMNNLFCCKSEGCGGWCEFEEGSRTFVCPVCNEINCVECGGIHTGVDCGEYKRLLDNGEVCKVAELMDKERKNGWGQLVQILNSCDDSVDGVLCKMKQSDLLVNTSVFECPICFCEEVGVGDGVILYECLHMFCKRCLVNLVEFNDEAVVKCPYIDGNYSCVCLMLPREIRALVPKELYEKHLQRSVKLGESSIPNSFHCKTPDCPGWCEYEHNATTFKCPICEKKNCIRCNAIHDGTCDDYKNSLKQKQNANDQLSLAAVEKLIKEGKAMRCPKCRIPVQKIAGCDWLKCTACRTEICWVTRGPRWGPKGRGDVTGGCKCNVNGKKCDPNCGNCH